MGPLVESLSPQPHHIFSLVQHCENVWRTSKKNYFQDSLTMATSSYQSYCYRSLAISHWLVTMLEEQD